MRPKTVFVNVLPPHEAFVELVQNIIDAADVSEEVPYSNDGQLLRLLEDVVWHWGRAMIPAEHRTRVLQRVVEAASVFGYMSFSIVTFLMVHQVAGDGQAVDKDAVFTNKVAKKQILDWLSQRQPKAGWQLVPIDCYPEPAGGGFEASCADFRARVAEWKAAKMRLAKLKAAQERKSMDGGISARSLGN